MKYASAAAFRQALETRLNSASRESGGSLVRLRKGVVFDRLLARLLATNTESWVLKGGLALDFRLGALARTTKDMDLMGPSSEDATTEAMIAAQAIDLGDHFSFEIERTDRLDQLVDGSAIRYRATASLAGRLFDQVPVDVGFDPSAPFEPDMIQGPDLLAFAGIPALLVAVLPLEIHVAEKLHAYTRRYADGRQASTRVKDLVDLALIASESRMDAARLHAAIAETFVRRGAHGVPDLVPPPPADWRTSYRRMAREIGLDLDLDGGHQCAGRFLDPLLSGEVRSGWWDPRAGHWQP